MHFLLSLSVIKSCIGGRFLTFERGGGRITPISRNSFRKESYSMTGARSPAEILDREYASFKATARSKAEYSSFCVRGTGNCLSKKIFFTFSAGSEAVSRK